MTETGMIDHSALDGLLESLGGDRKFLTELLQTYFDDASQQIAAMQAAEASGDAEALRRAAHSLKSNSASFGALALAAQCKELELMGKAGKLDGAAGKIVAAAAAYVRVKGDLEGECI